MPTTLTVNRHKTIYESIVLSIFSKMPHGSMRLSLPGGEVIQIGDGIGISAEIEVNDSDFFRKCVLFGDIGFGESYMEGDWNTPSVTDVIKWFLLNVEYAPGVSGSTAKSLALNVLKSFNKIYHWRRRNNLNGSKKNISAHYDLNNDFFQLFLDPTMTYSSGYFKEEGMTLQQAQIAKYDRLCRQLHLQPTDHVLEIGSGWGGNAIYMAKHYGCKVTTITISEEQFKLANERIVAENLTDKVKVELMDYRNMEGSFDKIVSIEMLEAVGEEFLDVYFKKCNDLLKKDGILAFQVITCPDNRYENFRSGVDWVQKHIFPGSLLPSVGRINLAINNTSDMTLVDMKDLGLHYARTLATWRKEFNRNIEEVRKLGFDEVFIRKWNYYLSYCEGAFAMRNINVMQMVYSRPNNTLR